jgi:glycosyltransferase involved in cell wall biosynthesis
MARAAIYVMPARYEPFGLSILEAAVSGCALVLGDIPSLRELWDGAALFVPPADRRKLAHVLGDLIADAGLRNKLADDAQKRAANFSLERMARQYVTVYQLLQDSVGDGSAIRSSALSGGC